MSKTFFKKDKSVSKGIAHEDKPKIIVLGAAWLGELKDSDLPYLSIRIGEEDWGHLEDIKDKSEDGTVRIMMFPNRHPREGHSDPDYYLFPPKEKE